MHFSKTIIFLLTVTIFYSCTIKIVKEDKVKSEVFENIAHITVDSCKKWNLPYTEFTLEYPNDFQIEYNADSKYYLRLRKFNNNDKVTEEITIGKSGVKTNEDAKFWLEKLNKGLKIQFDSYQFLSLVEKDIYDSAYYLLQGSLSFDKLKDPKFQGVYNTSVLILTPPNEQMSGLSIGVLQNSDTNKQTEAVLKTFSFLH